MIPSIIAGSLMRATPPAARMSAGTRSSAMTATAPASSAILRLLGRDDVHDDAALEHLGEALLGGPGGGFDGHVGLCAPGLWRDGPPGRLAPGSSPVRAGGAAARVRDYRMGSSDVPPRGPASRRAGARRRREPRSSVRQGPRSRHTASPLPLNSLPTGQQEATSAVRSVAAVTDSQRVARRTHSAGRAR